MQKVQIHGTKIFIIRIIVDRYCQKISNGKSPPVGTIEEWESFTKEMELITPDRSVLPYLWLPVTEGDPEEPLSTGHWPPHEIVDGESVKLEVIEETWRNFYTGERIPTDWAKPYYSSDNDTNYGSAYQCMGLYTDEAWGDSWYEMPCYTYDQGCPCSYPTTPLLRLRGYCETTLIGDNLFQPKQSPDDPNHMVIQGQLWSTIEYNDSRSIWILSDRKTEVTAISKVNKLSFAIGKHKWYVTNDDYSCNEGKPYELWMKLTGCKSDDGEFTCDDGQCIKMEERCNQIPDCRDESDEVGCQVVLLKASYNKEIPPITKDVGGKALPADVSISITLMKVVEIEEVDHSIHLQFQISMMWRENRVQYHNLKEKTSLNALTRYDIEQLWLPLIIYDNTDQKQETRLGAPWEWMTQVLVSKEGNFTRTDYLEVDEAEVFQGSENNLTMTQTYTLEFQCEYVLQRYPFDTQVSTLGITDVLSEY